MSLQEGESRRKFPELREKSLTNKENAFALKTKSQAFCLLNVKQQPTKGFREKDQ